jgi:hypothetical protein
MIAVGGDGGVVGGTNATTSASRRPVADVVGVGVQKVVGSGCVVPCGNATIASYGWRQAHALAEKCSY